MIHTYEQIFLKRADACQKAMELCPGVRDLEFALYRGNQAFFSKSDIRKNLDKH